MFQRILNWCTDRIGFRIPLEEEKVGAHKLVREASKFWFEFLKRVIILAAVSSVAKDSILLNIVLVITFIAVISPVYSWLESHEIDLKTRTPKGYRPHIDGAVISPIPPDQPPAWKYSLPLAFLSSILYLVLAVIIGNILVLKAAEALGRC